MIRAGLINFKLVWKVRCAWVTVFACPWASFIGIQNQADHKKKKFAHLRLPRNYMCCNINISLRCLLCNLLGQIVSSRSSVIDLLFNNPASWSHRLYWGTEVTVFSPPPLVVGVGQNIAVHASPAAKTSIHLSDLIFTFPIHSTSFFLRP